MYYLSVTAIFQNENHWLEEWLQFHLALGVEHFYLYNNDPDTTESNRILQPYIETGLVDHLPYPGQFRQLSAYQNALQEWADDSYWMTFLDLDELIVPKQVDSIPEFLEEFETENGLAIHWNIFGSGGLIETPPNQINHFLWRAVNEHPANKHVKSIVKPKYVQIEPMYNPHLFNLTEGITVNEKGNEVTDAICDYTGNRIRIAHYAVRSYQYFWESKAKRGSPIHPDSDKNVHYWNYFNRNEVFDNDISKRFGHLVQK
jgi:hypothetical protein